jgi:hypothetical protein
VIGFETILAFCLRRCLSEHGQLSLVLHKVLHNRKSGEGSAEEIVVFVHLCDHSSFVNELNIPRLESCLKHIVANHVQFQTTRLPETVHNLEKLQHQVILFEIVSTLEQKFYHLRLFFRRFWLIVFRFAR